ncbi:MAG: flagellar basal body L-ring protein FlgH [Firmicutes bacterium]|mgnify:CR=1 FL=1|nr:flagellar basal body L-ring protein FlgH [Bacillota bacterium]
MGLLKNIKRKPFPIFGLGLVIMLVSLVVADVVLAASLWQDGQGSIFTDTKAGNVGDLVTIIIVERTQASQSSETSTGKDTSVELGPGLGLLDFIPLAKAGAKDGRKAGGRNVQGGSFSARMTSQVVEVLPNGNLVIEGSQSLVVNRENQEITVRGIVRPQDIAADNTVLSTYISDASISYQGSGSLGTQQKPGIITQILNWIF